jgi:hypothetical protein
MHGVLESHVRVWIVGKRHTHKHSIQNIRESLNDEVKTLLVCLEDFVL